VSMISIADFGMGNIGSIANMLKKVGVEVAVVTQPDGLRAAEKIILPGVGAFDAAVSRIRDNGWWPVLKAKVIEERTPILGICLGMQLVMDSSEEGVLPGFGWVPGKVVRFTDDLGVRIPHMGWNNVVVARDCPLVEGLAAMDDCRFYFVHSYRVHCRDAHDAVLNAHYGVDFDAAVQRENVLGVQFHPEKSHRYGMALLRNFARM
jgi:imidazole glycerol-phosphate synthase subunit HisH